MQMKMKLHLPAGNAAAKSLSAQSITVGLPDTGFKTACSATRLKHL